jgi:glycosyl hydrolase family 26
MNRESTLTTRPGRSLVGVAALLVTLTTACSGTGSRADTVAASGHSTPRTSGAGAHAPAGAKKRPARKGADILVPAQGALLGHFYGAGSIASTDARIGRKPAVHLTYYDWRDNWTSAQVTRSDLADGRIPLVNWEPNDIDFDDIISGKLDATIRARADGAKALGQKFFLDFAAEMNEGEGWGDHDPAKYIAAYRHIHDVFVARGATNVVWAWCPNVTDSEGGPATMSYYPGDTYVDWTGVDGYNWGTSDPDFDWQSFAEVFRAIYPKLAAKGKPIIIGEMASDEVGGSKAKWIDDIVPTLKSKFPLIKAFVWFDIAKERQWRINSSSSALAAYARMAKDPYLNP